MEHHEHAPRAKEELIAERDRLLAALDAKRSQTEANIAAGVIAEDDRDEDREALEAELATVEGELSALRASEQDERMDVARQAPLEGI